MASVLLVFLAKLWSTEPLALWISGVMIFAAPRVDFALTGSGRRQVA